MPEQHGLHLIWPLSFSTCWYWTIFPGVWSLIFDTHLLRFIVFLNWVFFFFYLWCLHWLWAERLLMMRKLWKNHKTPKKKGCNILAFLASLRCAYAATSVEIWKTQKKGWEIDLHLSLFIFEWPCAAAWKIQKNQKKGMFYVRVWKLRISKKEKKKKKKKLFYVPT